MTKERELTDAKSKVKTLSERHSKNCTLQGKLQAEVEVCVFWEREIVPLGFTR